MLTQHGCPVCARSFLFYDGKWICIECGREIRRDGSLGKRSSIKALNLDLLTDFMLLFLALMLVRLIHNLEMEVAILSALSLWFIRGSWKQLNSERLYMFGAEALMLFATVFHFLPYI